MQGKQIEKDEIIEYIIALLLGDGNEAMAENVSYSYSNTSCVSIHPSGFFNRNSYMTHDSLPHLPLTTVQGIPLLFGDGRLSIEQGRIYVHADIIASTFFLITRYEEYVRRDARDEHGRFPGCESLPYRAGFLHRPIVEEYGRLLRGWLREAGVDVKEPTKGIAHVYLTHDVDMPWQKQYSFFGAMLRCIKHLLVNRRLALGVLAHSMLPLRSDALYQAFDWLIREDAKLTNSKKDFAESIFFLLCCDAGKNDRCYHKQRSHFRRLLDALQKHADIGMHISYAAGMKPELVEKEYLAFARSTGARPTICRYHYLSCREPQDLRVLIDVGITDDFTHAYADVAGFRLGTCRAVRWIDPDRMELTSLTLHPMTVMECTLDMEKYMGLSYDKAYAYCEMLINAIEEHAGEVTLLWHNTSVVEGADGYHRELYTNIINNIINRKHMNDKR